MINANGRGETIDPMSAHQFAAGIGQLVRLMVDKIDDASSDLRRAGVGEQPLACLAKMQVATSQLATAAAVAETYFRQHLAVQDHVQAVPHVGDQTYLNGAETRDLPAHWPSNDPDQDVGQEDEVGEKEPFTNCWVCGEPLATPVADENQARHPECDPDDGEAAPQEIYTTCGECGDPLAKPTTDPDCSFCEDCDPNAPPKYWVGELAANGKEIDQSAAEPYRRIEDVAYDAVDSVLEWERPYGDTYISFPDGSIVDAREWIERPENLALGGGRERYDGRGEVDPTAPDRCWIGRILPSGRLARPNAKSFEDISSLAQYVCSKVFNSKRDQLETGDYTVMLPGGQYVDAYDWAQHSETRQLAGCVIVRNLVEFRAVAACPNCGILLSTTATQLLEGPVGDQRAAAAALYCQDCDRRLPPVFVPITLVDDATGVTGASPRLINDNQ